MSERTFWAEEEWSRGLQRDLRSGPSTRLAGNLKDIVQVDRNQLEFARVPLLGRVTGHDVSSIQLLLLVPAVWVPP